MDKTVNQKAWFLVLPVFLVVAFSAVLPLMTVVNYSMQDTFGNNQFFWNGVGWFKELLDPSTDLGGRFLASLARNRPSPPSSSPSKCRSALSLLCRCRARAGASRPASSSWRCRS
jgi:ABC-type sugar transport system permease subunit